MSTRKGIMHPRVEELEASIPSNTSPIRRRSVLAQKVVSTTLVENDDEAELQFRRLEKTITPPEPAIDRRRSLGLSCLAQISSARIAENVQQCLQLSANNQINVKNAFNLQMIDFMTYMIKKKDENMNDLQVASMSLDVSTKIYGLRVDGIHKDIMKMSGGADKHDTNDGRRDSGQRDNTDANGENNAEDQAQTEKAKKKRKSKKKILVSSESLRGTIETVNPNPLLMGSGDTLTTDELYLAKLPCHANYGLSLHLYNDAVLETIDPEKEGNLATVSCSMIEDLENLDSCNSLENFKILGWSVDNEEVEEDEELTEVTAVHTDGFQFDLDASLPADAEPTNGTMMNYFDLEDDENAVACERLGQPAANIVDFREVVQTAKTTQSFEYSYIQEDMGQQWTGPSHWKFHRPSKHLAGSRVVGRCEQEPVRRKKELVLTMDDDAVAVANEKLRKPTGTSVTLQVKTARDGWSEEKITLPQDMHYKAAATCKYYLSAAPKNFTQREDANPTELPDEVGDYDYENELDRTEYCPNIDVDEQPATGENNAENATVGICTQAFTGDNLVELPKLTQEVSLAFSQRAKKIDMRQLKRCLWENLIGQSKDSREQPGAATGEKINGEVAFSVVYQELPKTLNKNNAEALSLPIAFASLLHLANEKVLHISSNDDKSDLIIRQG